MEWDELEMGSVRFGSVLEFSVSARFKFQMLKPILFLTIIKGDP